MLTQVRLMKALRYEPATGNFFRITRPGSRSDLVGKRAGSLTPKGHRIIVIEMKQYKAHRLAWLYVYGHFPNSQLDHINRIPDDNRIENLRLATNGQNVTNSKVRSSLSGLKGAHWNGREKKWRSIVYCGGKTHWLGRFATAEEAHAAYCKVAKELHGEFFHAG